MLIVAPLNEGRSKVLPLLCFGRADRALIGIVLFIKVKYLIYLCLVALDIALIQVVITSAILTDKVIVEAWTDLVLWQWLLEG